MFKKYRDLSIIEWEDKKLSIACDSSAGIGALESDVVETSGFNVGYFGSFVPLVETLAAGAKPIAIINTLSVSGHGYGQEIIDGVKSAAVEAGLNADQLVTGSTEENMFIPFTSIGITVVGDMTGRQLEEPIHENLNIVLVGLPMVGQEVLENRQRILNLKSVIYLANHPNVIDILPVGSKGIRYELDEMSKTLDLMLKLDKYHGIDLDKSAGPATCAIVAIRKESEEIFRQIHIPVTNLGEFSLESRQK